MKIMMAFVTIVAEIACFIMNVTMADAWQITGDVFYYIMGNIVLALGMGLIVAWMIFIKYENKNRKARE